MKIRYMFHSIRDRELVFRKEESEALNLFGEENTYVEISQSKEYSQQVLDDVTRTLRGTTEVKHCGSLERISREVFEIKIDQETYTVIFIIDQIDESYTKLQIEIESTDKDGEFEDRYDRTLEYLKIAIKNRLLQDWKTCIWMSDEQSELLCAELYPQIFRIENRVREFANRVLIRHLGFDWIELHGMEKYKESAKNMSEAFVSSVPDFRDINTTMLSVTLETLAEIMLEGMVYEPEYKFTPDEMQTLEKLIAKNQAENARKYILKKKNVVSDIWKDVVSIYLDDPEQFKTLFGRFIKNRNHIAHNKLLTFTAYKTMAKDFNDFDESVKKAIADFEDKNPSDEMLETIRLTNEQEEYDREYEKHYWRDRIQGETGVEILDEDEILDLFLETIVGVQEALEDRYHLDKCFDYSDVSDPAGEGRTLVGRVQSNAVEEEVLEIYVNISIDDEMDGDSTLEFEAIHDNECIASAECHYHNGSGREGDEGVCVADSDSEYDNSEVKDFQEEVFGFIEEDLNPFVRKIPAMEYEVGTEGGELPIADFPCEVCGKNGVSISEDFYPFGCCCYCGNENEVHVCEMCGTVFDDLGGEGNICNNCLIEDIDG